MVATAVGPTAARRGQMTVESLVIVGGLVTAAFVFASLALGLTCHPGATPTGVW